MCDLYTGEKKLLLTVSSNFMLRFIGVSRNYPLMKYYRPLIYEPFHESKNQDFVNIGYDMITLEHTET